MFYNVVFFLSPEAETAGTKVALLAGQYVLNVPAGVTIQALHNARPPADQSAEVAALTQQVADLTQALAACQAGNPMQTIDSFTATPNPVVAGQPVTLAWSTTGAAAVTLNGAPVALSGSQVVTPGANTTYTLSASAAPVTQAIDVVVQAGQPAPTVTNVAATPNQLPIGGGPISLDANTSGGGPVTSVHVLKQVGTGSVVDLGAMTLPATIPLP